MLAPSPRGAARLAGLAAIVVLVACQSSNPRAADGTQLTSAPPSETTSTAPLPGAAEAQSRAELETLIGRLYQAFCFDANGAPDWQVQREIFHPDCRFLGPVRGGAEPRSEDLEQFLTGFQQFASGPQRGPAGLHERILDLEFWSYEGVAQARVLFEGHLPGQLPALTRGIDALQLVRTLTGWRVVAFAAQYERSALAPESLDGQRLQRPPGQRP
jgi:hypothetical protein